MTQCESCHCSEPDCPEGRFLNVPASSSDCEIWMKSRQEVLSTRSDTYSRYLIMVTATAALPAMVPGGEGGRGSECGLGSLTCWVHSSCMTWPMTHGPLKGQASLCLMLLLSIPRQTSALLELFCLAHVGSPYAFVSLHFYR